MRCPYAPEVVSLASSFSVESLELTASDILATPQERLSVY